MSFEQEIAQIASGLPIDDMTSVYHTRESYVEALFEGVILMPRRRVSADLRHPTFSFVPDDTRRRLIKHSQIHFLGRRLRRLAHLTCHGPHLYTDAPQKVAATQSKSTDSFERESEIKLRRDILAAYCDDHHFAAFWVTDSYRFSERLPEEYDMTAGRRDMSGESFSYFHHFGTCDQPGRSRMHSVSLLCGKRLILPSSP